MSNIFSVEVLQKTSTLAAMEECNSGYFETGSNKVKRISEQIISNERYYRVTFEDGSGIDIPAIIPAIVRYSKPSYCGLSDTGE